jgi:hypothetical protein
MDAHPFVWACAILGLLRGSTIHRQVCQAKLRKSTRNKIEERSDKEKGLAVWSAVDVVLRIGWSHTCRNEGSVRLILIDAVLVHLYFPSRTWLLYAKGST